MVICLGFRQSDLVKGRTDGGIVRERERMKKREGERVFCFFFSLSLSLSLSLYNKENIKKKLANKSKCKVHVCLSFYEERNTQKMFNSLSTGVRKERNEEEEKNHRKDCFARTQQHHLSNFSFPFIILSPSLPPFLYSPLLLLLCLP